MDNKQQDALDTKEWGQILTNFAIAYSSPVANISKIIKTNRAINSFIGANFEPKKEQSNDKS